MKPEFAAQVLMIDDDEIDAMLVRQMVGKMPDAGCQVHWAGSCDQGLKALGEIDWDLCLVDYQLGFIAPGPRLPGRDSRIFEIAPGKPGLCRYRSNSG